MKPVSYLVASVVAAVIIHLVFRLAVRRSYRQSGRLTWIAGLLQYAAILSWVAFGWLNVPPAWPKVSVGFAQESIGWFLFIGGWAVTLGELMRLGVLRSHGLQVTTLRQTGMYGLSRNPQATAFLVAMLGYLVLWPTWRNLGVVLLVFYLLQMMIRSEEEHLRDVFAEEYRSYCERVPRYMGFRRRRPRPARSAP